VKGRAHATRDRGEIPGFDRHVRRALEGQEVVKQKGIRRGVAYGVPKNAVLRDNKPAFDSETDWNPSTAIARSPADKFRNTIAADVLAGVQEQFQPLTSTRYHTKASAGLVRRGASRAVAATESTLRNSADHEVAAEMELHAQRLRGAASPSGSVGLATPAIAVANMHISPTALRGPTAAVIRKSPTARVPAHGTTDRLAWFAQMRRDVATSVATQAAVDKAKAAGHLAARFRAAEDLPSSSRAHTMPAGRSGYGPEASAMAGGTGRALAQLEQLGISSHTATAAYPSVQPRIAQPPPVM
jgi:hypothetical protein